MAQTWQQGEVLICKTEANIDVTEKWQEEVGQAYQFEPAIKNVSLLPRQFLITQKGVCSALLCQCVYVPFICSFMYI